MRPGWPLMRGYDGRISTHRNQCCCDPHCGRRKGGDWVCIAYASSARRNILVAGPYRLSRRRWVKWRAAPARAVRCAIVFELRGGCHGNRLPHQPHDWAAVQLQRRDLHVHVAERMGTHIKPDCACRTARCAGLQRDADQWWDGNQSVGRECGPAHGGWGSSKLRAGWLDDFDQFRHDVWGVRLSTRRNCAS